METLGEHTAAQRFFAEIEEAFGRLRGRPLLLSPRDVALVRQWFEAGVPLRVVLKALDEFFDRERKRDKPRRISPSLAYCERDVYDLWEEWKSARIADRPGGEQGDAAASAGGLLLGHLEALAPRLTAAALALEARGEAKVAGAVRRVARELPQLKEAAAGGDWTALERTLREAEERVLKTGRKALGKDGLEELRGRVGLQVEAFKKGIDDKAYAVLLHKAEDRALLTRFGLPRIALFSF